METRDRKPGSVRLTDEQYREMGQLGILNESAYVKYKMNQGQNRLEALKSTSGDAKIKTLPIIGEKVQRNSPVEDQLTIQRLAMENQSLKNKLEEIRDYNQETLSGVNQKVHSLLQEELFKRDFEILKKEHAQLENSLKSTKEDLQKANSQVEEKQHEITELVKKLGFVELGKALLPGAISGLAQQYPSQMRKIADTLGSLGMGDAVNAQDDDENEKKQLLQIAEYIYSLFTETQFENLISLIEQIGLQIKTDSRLIAKMTYYLNQLVEKDKTNT